MRQYNDRMEMGEPEPVESFLPDPRDLPPMGPMPYYGPDGFEGPLPGPKRDAGAMFPPAPKSYIDVDGNLRFGDMPITTMPVGPRGPGMSIEDMLEGRVTTMPVEEPVRLSPKAIRDIIERREEPITRREEPRLMPMPVRMPEPAPVMPRISMPKLPDFSNIPTPEPVLRAGDIMPNSPVVDRRPSPRMPAPPAVAPINISNIPNIPNIDFSNLPKFDLPTTGGRPMIPNFGNINLR